MMREPGRGREIRTSGLESGLRVMCWWMGCASASGCRFVVVSLGGKAVELDLLRARVSILPHARRPLRRPPCRSLFSPNHAIA